jgi:transglutaminase-like putative cysteine protease
MRYRRAPLLAILAAVLGASCGAEPDAPAPSAPPASGAATPAAPPARPSPEPSNVLSDQWYRTIEDGQPSGWLHVRWTRGTYEGRPVVHDRTESFTATTRRMGGEADEFEMRTFADLDRSDDGLVWRFEVHEQQGGHMSDSVELWTGKGYEQTKHDAGGEEKHSVACDAPCSTDSEMFLSKKLAEGTVSVGQRYEYRFPNFVGSRLDTMELKVEAKESLALAGGAVECFRVAEHVEGAPVEATLWLDGKGVFRKRRDGPAQIVATTEARAKDLSEGGAVYSITVAADPEIPRCTTFDRSVIEVKLAPREGVEMPDFPPTPFSHEVSRQGDSILVELTSHDEAPGKVTLPVTDPQFARHLERTNLFCYDAPRVKAALKDAAGDEKDPAQIVRKILRYVFVTLRKQSGPTPEPTAVEILEEGCGDCSEHCALFVTLCRGAGIPARRVSGWAQVGDMWGSHSFAEVWLGRWIGCDPTTNEFGTKARYLAFGWNDDADSFPGVVSSRVTGRISIRTVEFTEGGRTWKVADLTNPSERVDVLSGISLAEPPEGWHDGIGAVGQARISGPGVQADVGVVSGYGDLPCEVLAKEMCRGWKPAKFAGRDALRDEMTTHGRVTLHFAVPYARRLLSVRVHVDDPEKKDAALATIAALLAPTFADATPTR